MVLVGLIPTFSRSRTLTFLPDTIRATSHSRGMRHDPQLAGGAAVKCMVSGCHMKWKPALLGSCTSCFGVMSCLKHQDIRSHPLAGRGHLDVFYRAPNSSSTPLPFLHPCSWRSWRPACLTQAVTHTSLQPLFSDLHLTPILCSSEHTCPPPLAESAASHLETSPAAGLRCPGSGWHHPGEGPLGK